MKQFYHRDCCVNIYLMENERKLVEVALVTRRAVILTGIVLFISVSFWLLRNPAKEAFRELFPPKVEPTSGYGALNPLEFVAIEQIGGPVSYTLNTSDGRLPSQLPDKLRVYRYKPKPFSYSAGKNAQEDALILGFTDTMLVSDLSSERFIWEDINFGGSLIIDTITGGLLLDTPLRGLGNLFPRTMLNEQNATRRADKLLSSLNREIDPMYFDEDVTEKQITYAKFGTYGLIKADSSLEAQATKIDYYRNLNNLRILPPNPYQAMVQVTMRNEDRGKFAQLNYPQMRVISWTIDTGDSQTYPLLPVETAWENITQGKGVVAGIRPGGANPFYALPTSIGLREVLINDIYLAYYDSHNSQEHLQPIYVFEGNYRAASANAGEITIYYPAVDPSMIKQPQQTEEETEIIQ
jgi:hypothetical protein